MKKPEILNEIPRDIISLGSWVFYVLVVVRALIKPYRPFADQLIFAGILLIASQVLIKNNKGYISRSLALVFFTSIFYENIPFAIFASFIFLCIVYFSKQIEKKNSRIFQELIIGLISLAFGYYIPQLIS